MRKQLVACLLGLLCACTVNAQRKSDREAAGLNGPVKSVRTEWAKLTTANGKTVESARRLRSLTVYDEQGNRSESTSFDHTGSVLSKTFYNRDAQGNSVNTSYDGHGKLVRKTIQLIDQQGRFVGFLFLDPDGQLRQRSAETRGANGKLAEEAVYDGTGKLLYKNVFSYNGEGQQTEFAVYDSAGKLTQKTVWAEGGGFHTTQYDERGNVKYESTHKVSTIEDVDPQGNWTEQHTPEKNTQNGHTEEYIGIIYRTIEYYPPKKN